MRSLVLAIDFDGTIAIDRYPEVGRLKRQAKEYLDRLYDDGHRIIINSCRAGYGEDKMRQFLDAQGIRYHAINSNLPDRIAAYQNDCRKVGADLYIDDKGVFANRIITWPQIYAYITKMAATVPVILCIVGESGTGKTEIATYIEQEYGIPMLRSCTDRPPRSPDEDGHRFLTPAEFDTIDHKIAATEFGGYRYACRPEDLQARNTYVITEDGYENLLREADGRYRVVGIRVCRPAALRLVDPDRIARDRDRFVLPLISYQYVIDNVWTEVAPLYDCIDTLLVDLFHIDRHNTWREHQSTALIKV
ncbi:MAG: hypothetical protein PHR28_14690 [candidate division Zixibacteria bacterium]|jgi:hypothetical protein|nr:hypothetical protein [candidate division Zixibacteria bacterium]